MADFCFLNLQMAASHRPCAVPERSPPASPRRRPASRRSPAPGGVRRSLSHFLRDHSGNARLEASAIAAVRGCHSEKENEKEEEQEQQQEQEEWEEQEQEREEKARPAPMCWWRRWR
jgi:hypothetical protein